MQVLKLRKKEIELGRKTLITGILNVTPDSFSDGGFFDTPEKAINQAEHLIKAGADIIDIGAESTRPNFIPVTAEEEIFRLEKILPSLAKLPVPISIDTYKSEVAEYALKSGAEILNDIHGLQFDGGEKAKIAAKFNAPVIAMHNRPENFTPDGDIIAEIKNFFRRTFEIADKAGLPRSQIIFDPGIGFGTTREEDLTILRRIEEL